MIHKLRAVGRSKLFIGLCSQVLSQAGYHRTPQSVRSLSASPNALPLTSARRCLFVFWDFVYTVPLTCKVLLPPLFSFQSSMQPKIHFLHEVFTPLLWIPVILTPSSTFPLCSPHHTIWYFLRETSLCCLHKHNVESIEDTEQTFVDIINVLIKRIWNHKWTQTTLHMANIWPKCCQSSFPFSWQTSLIEFRTHPPRVLFQHCRWEVITNQSTMECEL